MNARMDELRVPVAKTYKLYIGGKFPRTESGRYDQVKLASGTMVNVCRGSRKDFRNAVVAARKAHSGWQSRTAYNRSQILYRIAEMLEGRKAQFVSELIEQGSTAEAGEIEVASAIDLLVYYAGWCDKYQQIFSSVNPVAASYFNFSVPEPTGVVCAIAPDRGGLLGLLECVCPVIVGGNSVIALASEQVPLCAISLAEVLHTSDLPGGVVNILTGRLKELGEHFASHMDVNAITVSRGNDQILASLQRLAANNVKRLFDRRVNFHGRSADLGPYPIMDTQEVKTTWHPIMG